MTLKEYRKQKHMTLRQLAQSLGVSRQTVFNYECGVCNPTKEMFQVMKSLLGISEDFRDMFPAKRPWRLYGSMKCSHEGCERKAQSRGMCLKHYMQSRRDLLRNT